MCALRASYSPGMARQARVADVHRIAAAMPHVRKVEGSKGNPVYQVGQ